MLGQSIKGVGRNTGKPNTNEIDTLELKTGIWWRID